MIDTVCKGTAIEICILWNHLPMIILGQIISLQGCKFQTMLHEKPLGLNHHAIALYTIIIGISFGGLFYTPVNRPLLTIESSHRNFQFLFIILLYVQDELLAEHCSVFDMKMYRHKSSLEVSLYLILLFSVRN